MTKCSHRLKSYRTKDCYNTITKSNYKQTSLFFAISCVVRPRYNYYLQNNVYQMSYFISLFSQINLQKKIYNFSNKLTKVIAHQVVICITIIAQQFYDSSLVYCSELIEGSDHIMDLSHFAMNLQQYLFKMLHPFPFLSLRFVILAYLTYASKLSVFYC